MQKVHCSSITNTNRSMLPTEVIAKQTPSVLRMHSLHILKRMFQAVVQRPTVLSVCLSVSHTFGLGEAFGVCTPQHFDEVCRLKASPS